MFFINNSRYVFESKIGVPCKKSKYLDKYEWEKGFKLSDTFSIPFNCIGSLQEVFNRFQLWENLSGVCVKGINHLEELDDDEKNIYKTNTKQIICKVPIYVGDTIGDNTVIYCRNELCKNSDLYYCNPIFGEIPPPCNVPHNEEDLRLKHLINIENLLLSLVERTCDFFDDYTEVILKTTRASNTAIRLTVTGMVGNLPITGGIAIGNHISEPLTVLGDLEAIKNKFKNSLKESFEKVKESIIC